MNYIPKISSWDPRLQVELGSPRSRRTGAVGSIPAPGPISSNYPDPYACGDAYALARGKAIYDPNPLPPRPKPRPRRSQRLSLTVSDGYVTRRVWMRKRIRRSR